MIRRDPWFIRSHSRDNLSLRRPSCMPVWDWSQASQASSLLRAELSEAKTCFSEVGAWRIGSLQRGSNSLR